MNSLKLVSAAVVSTVLTSPAAFATNSVTTDAANNYFESNRAAINTGSRPHQPAARGFEDIVSSYFDANWALFTNDGQPAERPAEETDDANTH